MLLLNLVLIGLAIAFDPLPLTAFTVVLPSSRGARKGAATVMGAKLSSWESYLALSLFCVLASSSYLAMEIYAGFRPGQSQAFLARFRTWMNTRTDQVIIVGSLILGSGLSEAAST